MLPFIQRHLNQFYCTLCLNVILPYSYLDDEAFFEAISEMQLKQTTVSFQKLQNQKLVFSPFDFNIKSDTPLHDIDPIPTSSLIFTLKILYLARGSLYLEDPGWYHTNPNIWQNWIPWPSYINSITEIRAGGGGGDGGRDSSRRRQQQLYLTK